ncbi:pentapeptide repeat-containing protein [Phormidium sp. LEGE 05292]|uniref:globin domain-containing protein n=1 Tax=[Phormidium] sp. LEGE 05292 TaxID=767427 RepID=UPI001881C029|nr:pentapeptide repeat-containing protein [Phormidium sp. LEGE 05292]MBE9226678.1 pentapeptide repeat-containing protein [Phormidium sp. LEGE 05292]
MSLNVELLEQSFEKIKPHANEFVVSFYENLFAANPEVKPLFAQADMTNLYKKLLNSLVLVVQNIRQPENLGAVLNALGARHVSYGAIPKYYGLVGAALLTTFEQYLQTDWTPEVKQTWLAAYQAITAQMLKGAGVEFAAKVTPEQPEFTTPTTVKTSVSQKPELPIELLEQSFDKIKPHANEFVVSFYENLFAANPEVKPLFAQTDMTNQYKKLLNSLVLVVENLRQPENVGAVLNALGARHVSYGAIPKYYGPVGTALLTTFEQYLQADWTPEVKQAWLAAYQSITAEMIKGANEISSPKVAATATEKPTEVKVNQPQVKPQKSPEMQEKATIGKWVTTFINIPKKLVDAFWVLPAWLVAVCAALLFILVYLFADENSVVSEILESADVLSLVIALVLFIKEAPDRRKQFHYQAWSTIDAAHGVKVSYARVLALQDLNEDGVSLRGLDTPGAELVDINLPKANLSSADLSATDLTNANLSYANLDNANLNQSKLSGANLSHANFGFAKLNQANLSSANFSNANLICADLTQANLSGANLKNASLSGANLEGAYLTGANLKGAKVSDLELSVAFLESAIMPDGKKYKSI